MTSSFVQNTHLVHAVSPSVTQRLLFSHGSITIFRATLFYIMIAIQQKSSVAAIQTSQISYTVIHLSERVK